MEQSFFFIYNPVMKLEPLFTVKDHNLYQLSDNKQINPTDLTVIDVKWSEVEMEEEIYNESFLAELRDKLKIMDLTGKFAIINAIADKPMDSAEAFTNAFNHTARRIKDCISVAGIQLPEELTSKGEDAVQEFIDVLSIKHAQYVYFSKSQNIQNSQVVIY